MNRIITLLIVFLLASSLASAETKEKDRLEAAARVFQEIMDTPDKSIPVDLLERCECVAVVPSMKKGGFIFGGLYGRGVGNCRQSTAEGAWGSPSMIALEGGSFGLQIGGAAVDVIMLIMGKDGVNTLLKNKFTLGGDASVAAGPVGRAGMAETDAYMKAKILSYSRSRGVFAGLEIKGSSIRQDRDGNQNLYGKVIGAKELLMEGKEPIPPDAKPFIDVLSKFSPGRNKKPL